MWFKAVSLLHDGSWSRTVARERWIAPITGWQGVSKGVRKDPCRKTLTIGSFLLGNFAILLYSQDGLLLWLGPAIAIFKESISAWKGRESFITPTPILLLAPTLCWSTHRAMQCCPLVHDWVIPCNTYLLIAGQWAPLRVGALHGMGVVAFPIYIHTVIAFRSFYINSQTDFPILVVHLFFSFLEILK